MTNNIWIVGLDDLNRERLESTPIGRDSLFHAALTYEEIRSEDGIPVPELLERAIDRIEAAPEKPDAICSVYDFPGTTLTPILCERFGLRGPSLTSVVACEHKYWSRLEQAKVIGEHIPHFRAVDPFDENAYEKIDFAPPFWVKPIKSFRSYLAFRINGRPGFEEAMAVVREHIDYLGRGFQYILENFDVPQKLASMPEKCIAESTLSGSMCTLEGYVFEGNVVGYGLVDSVRDSDRSSFSRYEYPSSLSLEVQHRIVDIARRAVTQVGLDNTTFNAEFFYDATSDQVYLLEINPRCSQSHATLFQHVHGVSHFNTMLCVALGKKPRPADRRSGQFSVAANFMTRVFEPGQVVRAPGEAELERLGREIPGASAHVYVKNGLDLGTLARQDSYSFELANVFIGGRDPTDVVEKYHKALDILGFEVEVRRLAPVL